MKLELKHLVGYLPYGLTFLPIHYNPSKRIDILYQLSTINSSEYFAVNGYTSNYIKPILRPLSDLTKEIEVNGKKFVPIVELLKIKYPSQDKEGRYSIIEVSEKGCPSAYFKYQANRDITIFTNYIENEKHWIIKKIYEWHFDIDGLIPADLAIDINEI